MDFVNLHFETIATIVVSLLVANIALMQLTYTVLLARLRSNHREFLMSATGDPVPPLGRMLLDFSLITRLERNAFRDVDDGYARVFYWYKQVSGWISHLLVAATIALSFVHYSSS